MSFTVLYMTRGSCIRACTTSAYWRSASLKTWKTPGFLYTCDHILVGTRFRIYSGSFALFWFSVWTLLKSFFFVTHVSRKRMISNCCWGWESGKIFWRRNFTIFFLSSKKSFLPSSCESCLAVQMDLVRCFDLILQFHIFITINVLYATG